jgi:hypothetical protein
MTHKIALCITLFAFLGCDDKKDTKADEAKGPPPATAEDCQKAYEHLADLKLKKDPGDFTKEKLLELDKGNIESCTKKGSKAQVDCLLAIKEHDMMAIADCSGVDKKKP